MLGSKCKSLCPKWAWCFSWRDTHSANHLSISLLSSHTDEVGHFYVWGCTSGLEDTVVLWSIKGLFLSGMYKSNF